MNKNTTTEEFKGLYNELKELTNNFREISPKVITQNSKYILVLRIILGLSMEDCAKICNRVHGSIYNLEREEREIDYKTAKHYTKNLAQEIKERNLEPNINKAIRNFKRFSERAEKGVSVLPKKEQQRFAKIGARAAIKKRKKDRKEYYKATRKGIKSQKLTEQEKRIVKVLKQHEFSFDTHVQFGNENVDIYIREKIPVLIGCASTSKKQYLTHHARRLMYQAYRIKYNKDNVIYIAALGLKSCDLNKNDLPKGAQNLLEEICDGYIVDEGINNLSFNIPTLLLHTHRADNPYGH